MLIQFTLKNFLSFKDQASLDMSAIPAYSDHDYNLIHNNGDSYLKVAAIYGANASGKSNIFAAFNIFQKIIDESFNSVPHGEKIPIHKYYKPFQFDKESNNTEFEVVLLIEGLEYKYGFEYNQKEIVAEWLYEIDTKDKIIHPIFEREEKIQLGPKIQEECSIYIDQIPKETLLLSFLGRLRLKSPVFKKIYQKINTIATVSNHYYHKTNILERLLPQIIDNKEARDNLLDFLRAIDAGIKDIEYHVKDRDLYFCTSHEDREGNIYKLPLYKESEGTVKSILVYIEARQAIKENKTMLIDELNTQLHPLLLKFIIDLFYSKDSRAQLIYTTHDTTLLDQRFFRRDQIWFVQKDSSGHSSLTSLAEYQIPNGGNFGINYLAGVYGAIPELKDFDLKVGD